MTKPRKGTLIDKLDEAAVSLLKELEDTNPLMVEEGKIVKPPTPLQDKVSIFNSVSRYLAIKHKIDPEEQESGLDELVNELHGRGGKRGRNSSEKPPNGSG